MESFLFCLLTVGMAAFGGREQMVVAQLSDGLADRSGLRSRRPFPVLALAGFSAVLTAAIMAYAGLSMHDLLPARASQMLVALALAIAAFELAMPVRLKPVNEPTRSAVAIALVLFFRQLGDAPRFVIFAFSAQANYPVAAWLGGAVGGVAVVAAGWALGAQTLSKWPLKWSRMGLAVLVFIAALFIGLDARFGGF